MAVYEPTIGLEIHAELNTKTKMFCDSRNDPFAAEANTHVCPVCMAHPGTLPVINREAVRHVLRLGAAIEGTLADYTEFDRKNYFYPDLPKGYQLSQFEYPLVSGGELHGVRITRVHLEEDTASSVHDEDAGATLVDYNRAGVPLMELVTEPDIKSAEQAGAFARELQMLLRSLGASGANMEKGEMRVEANVSVAKAGERSSAYVELKNINSFNTMERAVRYEIERQTAALERGETIQKETRGWDDARQASFVQRSKEGSADYRYFPDPDLPSLRISEMPEFSRNALREDLPELPAARRARYVSMGVKAQDAELYVRDAVLGNFFDSIARLVSSEHIALASNYIANDLVSMLRQGAESGSRDSLNRDSETVDSVPISPNNFAKLITLLSGGTISSRAAKDILAVMARDDTDPEVYANEQNLIQKNDAGSLEATVVAIIEQNPSVIADYKAGKATALEYLLGQCMKALRGAGNPATLRALLERKLSDV